MQTIPESFQSRDVGVFPDQAPSANFEYVDPGKLPLLEHFVETDDK